MKSDGTLEHECREKRAGGGQAASRSGAWCLGPSA